MIPKLNNDVSKLKRAAYQLADQHQERVFVVYDPVNNTDYFGRKDITSTPYCILESQASAWEKENGELVTPREI